MCTDMDYTVLPANHTTPAFTRSSPGGATTEWTVWMNTIWWSLLLIYRPRDDERLSWPCWLTYSGRFTHINGYPSAAGPVQTSESSLYAWRLAKQTSIVWNLPLFPSPMHIFDIKIIKTRAVLVGMSMVTIIVHKVWSCIHAHSRPAPIALKTNPQESVPLSEWYPSPSDANVCHRLYALWPVTMVQFLCDSRVATV